MCVCVCVRDTEREEEEERERKGSGWAAVHMILENSIYKDPACVALHQPFSCSHLAPCEFESTGERIPGMLRWPWQCFGPGLCHDCLSLWPMLVGPQFLDWASFVSRLLSSCYEGSVFSDSVIPTQCCGENPTWSPGLECRHRSSRPAAPEGPSRRIRASAAAAPSTLDWLTVAPVSAPHFPG